MIEEQAIATNMFYLYDKNHKLSDRDRLIFNAGFMACFDGLSKGNPNEVQFLNYEELDKC